MKNYLHIETPDEALVEQQTKDFSNAFMDNLPIIAATLAASITPGMSNAIEGYIKSKNGGELPKLKLGFGGVVEAEGGEVMQTPDGKVKEIKGNKHEQGGVNLAVPAFTAFFSDRLKLEGKTIAERKRDRAKKLKKLEAKLKKDTNNQKTKFAYERMKKYDEEQTKRELLFQEYMKNMLHMEYKKYAFGGVTAGDLLGMYGNLYQGFKLMQNTKKNRSQDTPHRNFYENFNKETLDMLDRLGGMIRQNFSTAAADDLTAFKMAEDVTALGTRSTNVQRAAQVSLYDKYQQGLKKLMMERSRQLEGLGYKMADAMERKDRAVAQGAKLADDLNRADRDRYFSEHARDITSLGASLAHTGKAMNSIKERNTRLNLLQAKYPWIKIDDNGKVAIDWNAYLASVAPQLLPQQQEPVQMTPPEVSDDILDVFDYIDPFDDGTQLS